MDNGTLLGAVRDAGVMLPHDDDFDTGVYFPEYTDELLTQLHDEIKAWLPSPYNLRIVRWDRTGRCANKWCDKIEVFDPTYGKKTLDRGEGTDFHHVTVDIQVKHTQKTLNKEHTFHLDSHLSQVYSGVGRVQAHHDSERTAMIQSEHILPLTTVI